MPSDNANIYKNCNLQLLGFLEIITMFFWYPNALPPQIRAHLSTANGKKVLSLGRTTFCVTFLFFPLSSPKMDLIQFGLDLVTQV